ncbi:MAG TPA: hypothetical protein VLV16_02425 [Gemmatimonadales bacterium]|nr:hypothetical protein [Gemmatimonadales bacterium]
MKKLIVLAAFGALVVSGCASVDASRQDRCQRAEWAKVGERDGLQGNRGMAERYANICGDMFQPDAYQEGLKKGLARRPTPPV